MGMPFITTERPYIRCAITPKDALGSASPSTLLRLFAECLPGRIVHYDSTAALDVWAP